MLSDALIIFRKEAGNVFRDRRAIFANYILPLILMPIMFGAIGLVQKNQSQSRADTVYNLSILNSPGADFESILAGKLKYQTGLSPQSPEGLTVEFPAGYSAGDSAQVKLYFDSTRGDLSFAADQASQALSDYNSILSKRKLADVGLSPADVSPIAVKKVDIAPPKSQGSAPLAIFLPYLLVIYVFAGAMGIGLAVTAGEKEKGSLASLLVNQVSRSSIAVGKVLFVLLSSLINSVSSAVGIIVALILIGSLLGGGPAAADAQNAGFQGFGIAGTLGDPLNLLVIFLGIICASAIAASLVVFIGILARNMKEAGGYITPIYLVVIVAGVATMNMDLSQNIGLYLIPLVNTIFLLKAAILGSLSLGPTLIVFAMNILAVAVLIFFIAREFKSERVLYTV